MPRSQKFLIVKPWTWGESCIHAALLASTFTPLLVGEPEDEMDACHFDQGDQEEGVIVASVRKDEYHCELLALGDCTVSTES